MKVESLIILKDWTAEKAECQMQPTELNHGLKSGKPLGSQAREGVDPMELTKLMVRRKVRVRCVVKVMPSGIAMFLRNEVFRRNGALQRS